jgi:ATPase complex subunit ATP10
MRFISILTTVNNVCAFLHFGNKEAILKERARLKDEMNRGYFADLAEHKKHGGKISVANKVLIPAMVAVKFPELEVNNPNGVTLKLPIKISKDGVGADKSVVPGASLVCLAFRASSKEMIESWSRTFLEAFSESKNVHMYEISFVDSWVLRLSPIKWLLLRTMRKSDNEKKNALQRQFVYSFGDHYYFRKELKILNLLTGYIFLLDKSGRVRWQGCGKATEDELSSLLSCTSKLLEEK